MIHRAKLLCGDFNAHNCLWGRKKTDNNGEIDDFIEEHSTRMAIMTGVTSCLDLTITSAALAGKCTRAVCEDNMGSDH